MRPDVLGRGDRQPLNFRLRASARFCVLNFALVATTSAPSRRGPIRKIDTAQYALRMPQPPIAQTIISRRQNSIQCFVSLTLPIPPVRVCKGAQVYGGSSTTSE